MALAADSGPAWASGFQSSSFGTGLAAGKAKSHKVGSKELCFGERGCREFQKKRRVTAPMAASGVTFRAGGVGGASAEPSPHAAGLLPAVLNPRLSAHDTR